MLNALKSDLRLAVAETKLSIAYSARKAVLAIAGGLLAMVGAAFLTSAAWIYLSRIGSPLIAALVIGGVYLLAGVVLIAIGGQRRPLPIVPVLAPPAAAAVPPALGPKQSLIPPLVEAFFVGLNAAQAGRRRRRRPRHRYREDEEW